MKSKSAELLLRSSFFNELDSCCINNSPRAPVFIVKDAWIDAGLCIASSIPPQRPVRPLRVMPIPRVLTPGSFLEFIDAPSGQGCP